MRRRMQRREFIAFLGGTAAWPLAVRAQPDGRVRRMAVVMADAESDPVEQAWLAALRQRLQQLGWIEGRNIRFDVRFNARDLVLTQRNAQGLISLVPDVIVVTGAAGTRALQERTQTIPIVFVQ